MMKLAKDKIEILYSKRLVLRTGPSHPAPILIRLKMNNTLLAAQHYFSDKVPNQLQRSIAPRVVLQGSGPHNAP